VFTEIAAVNGIVKGLIISSLVAILGLLFFTCMYLHDLIYLSR
jgi:hypothetical protein